ncbi:MAG: SH3 domain-containing protein [Leptospirales bacterium]
MKYTVILLGLLVMVNCKKTETTVQNQDASPEEIGNETIEPGIIEVNIGYSQEYYSLVEKLNIRNVPDIGKKSIGTLAEGEKVTFLKLITMENIDVKLRGKTINAPFYKIKTKNGLEGWVFAGALTEIPPQLYTFDLEKKKSQHDSFLEDSNSIVDAFDENSEANSSSKTLKKDDFYGPKAKSLYTIKHGVEQCAGTTIETNFYDNGKVIYTELGNTVYYYDEFQKLPNGIYPNMEPTEVEKLFGKPSGNYNNTWRYKVDHQDTDYGIQGYVYFFFDDGVLFGLMMNIFYAC